MKQTKEKTISKKMGVRPQFVAFVLLAGLGTLLLASRFAPPRSEAYLSQSPQSFTQKPDPSQAPDKTQLKNVFETNPNLTPSTPLPSQTIAAGDEIYVSDTITQLQDLALSNIDKVDAANTIIPALSNGDVRIRTAAVTAAVQCACEDALPALRGALAGAEDTEEKLRLQKAIEFLELPVSP